jgi:hypothetical protein
MPEHRELSEAAKAVLRDLGGKPEIGLIETRVRVYFANLDELNELDSTYAAMAYNLARKLDRDAGPVTASVNKELRELLVKVAESQSDTVNLWEQLAGPVSPQVGNTTKL